jgi:Ca2+-binding RTX toxin-like protein
MRLALAAVLAALALPSAASASSVSYQGDMLVFQAAPGETNFVVVDGDDQEVTFTDDQPIAFPAGRCRQDDPEYPLACETPAGGVRIDLGDGADHGSFGFMIPADRRFEIDGGPGADILTGPRNGVGAATLDGGDGDDQITSEETPDTLLGGPGADTLTGGAGGDTLRGGDGADKLRGDDPSGVFADVLDGGAGDDELLDDYNTGDPSAAGAVTITLDGVADDGRAGERDDILGVETFSVGAIGTFAGDDADNAFFAPEDGPPAHLMGRGGNDVLTGTDSHGDVVDGGTGDDTLSGGFGNDTVVGGPGRDNLAGDRPARCNELHCDFMDGFGNDTIDARDGEQDSVQCGPGEDSVLADAIDLVADDCEHVDGAIAGGPAQGSAGGGGARGGAAPRRARITAVGSRRLAAVLRHGLRVRTGSPRRLKVTARLAHAVVARGTGRGTIRLKLTAAGRRRLRHARRAVLRLSAGAARGRVVLTRR